MPSPKKKAAENLLKRRKAEEEKETLTARVISRRGGRTSGDLEKGRSIKLSDLTSKAKKEYLHGTKEGSNYKNKTNKQWYSDLAKNYPEEQAWGEGHLDTGVDKWLYHKKGMDVYNRPESIKKLIKKGVLKPSLMPSIARKEAARKLMRKKRGIHRARTRPLEDVAKKDMTAKERREWARKYGKDKD
jgi:hypothetical protein|tara:strand:+ start:1801 stop:2361 length:561 start_codon:yes stop_codon:yes gene_type:complete